MAPVDAAVFVLKAASMARTEPLSAEPPLKPNHPNQIKTVPRKTSVVLCAFPIDLSSGFFFLLPSTSAYARADQPEEIWTGPPPAKSRDGSCRVTQCQRGMP